MAIECFLTLPLVFLYKNSETQKQFQYSIKSRNMLISFKQLSYYSFEKISYLMATYRKHVFLSIISVFAGQQLSGNFCVYQCDHVPCFDRLCAPDQCGFSFISESDLSMTQNGEMLCMYVKMFGKFIQIFLIFFGHYDLKNRVKNMFNKFLICNYTCRVCDAGQFRGFAW